jgi:hypothetical protein
MKTNNSPKLFDEHRQSSQRLGPRNGDIEEILLKDEREAEKVQLAAAKARERRKVYQCIKDHPGILECQLRGFVGPTTGLTEWLRDGIVIRKNGGLYAV